MLLLDMVMSCSLTYLHNISVPRPMEWNFTKNKDGVPIGNFGSHSPCQNVLGRFVIGLLPGRVVKDFPLGKSPQLAGTFFKDFLTVKRQ